MRFLTILLISLFCGLFAQAKGHSDFGAGIVLGNPSALTAKYWLDQKTAIDANLAFSFSDYVLFHSNYLMHYPGFFKGRNLYVNQMVPYFGFGALIVIAQKDRDTDDGYLGKKSGSFGLGVRVPVGVEWLPNDAPVGIFAEIAPGLAVMPATTGFIEAGIGVRYYF